MENRTSFLIVDICALGFSVFLLYKTWFDIDTLRKNLIKRTENLPDWYPFRNHTLKFVDKPLWVWQVRGLSALLTVMILFATILFFLNSG